MYTPKKENRERAIVVGIVRSGHRREQVDEYLDELELLADTAGADIVERMVQEREHLDPAYMIGKGKVRELANAARYLDADLIIFDDDLSPAQAKNLEEICKIKILDRSGLILDIFAKHARTREARIQVELAQLRYLSSRLTRQWTHLSRQVGGIGVRGPGETQLETDRRLLRKRIALLERNLEKINMQRDNRRKNRKEVLKAALVGYTNVGKSTILNALTEASVLVEDQLFATLDATVRLYELADHQKILLIDTVGFIRKLPHHLVASFKSTLQEAEDADLLLHVIDISHPAFREQMETVERVLKELKIANKPIIRVFNKIDKLEDLSIINGLKEREQPCVFISAGRGIFLSELSNRVNEELAHLSKVLRIEFPVSEASLVARLHTLSDVYSTEYQDSWGTVELKATLANVARIKNMLHASECVITDISESQHANTYS